MASKATLGQLALPAVCVAISMPICRDENWQFWLDGLREVLKVVGDNFTVAQRPLAEAAYGVTVAKPGRELHDALSRLNYEVQNYYAHAAAHRLDELRGVA
jgi:hypothetical protein